MAKKEFKMKSQKIPIHIYKELEKISEKNKIDIQAIINIAVGEWLNTQRMFK